MEPIKVFSRQNRADKTHKILNMASKRREDDIKKLVFMYSVVKDLSKLSQAKGLPSFSMRFHYRFVNIL